MTITMRHPSSIRSPMRDRSDDDHTEELSGWGRTNPVRCRVLRPHDVLDVDAMSADRSAVIARGRGRSYGDAAQSVGGTVIDTSDLDAIRAFDPERGTITVDGGLTLDRLLQFIVPRGWFVAVTPGTRQVSIGGAIASDVHGKNHHHDGTRRLGRGLLMTGEHATRAQVGVRDSGAIDSSRPSHSHSVRLPDVAVPLLHPSVGKVFNRACYRINTPGEHLESIGAFFHPLDAVANWNLLYGRKGFIQW